MSIDSFENKESKISKVDHGAGDHDMSASAITGAGDQAIYSKVINSGASGESSLPSFTIQGGAIEFGAVDTNGNRSELKVADNSDGDSGGSLLDKLKARAEGAYEFFKDDFDLGKMIRDGVHNNTGAFGDALKRGGTEDSEMNRRINVQIKDATS